MSLRFLALAVFASVAASTASANSIFLDREPLYFCGGSLDLRQAYNGDLSIKFNNLSTWNCSTLRIYDYSSGRTINSYVIAGPDASYTLSKNQLYSLSTDCRLGLQIYGAYRNEPPKAIYIPNCRPQYNPYPYPYPSQRITYEWSNKGNCKRMINGQFDQLVSDYYCGGAPSQRITYEWSNKGNCKRMINGRFDQLVSDSYCYGSQQRRY